MISLPKIDTCTVAVIGLGYVGLPLALEFSRQQECLRTGALIKRRVIGFDINEQRLDELRDGVDRTNESSVEDLRSADFLEFTSDCSLLSAADVFIVTVPTPIDKVKRPHLTALVNATSQVGQALKARSFIGSETIPIVIFESTVYPCATEEVCVPVLERESGLLFNQDFFCGYSPERINPGDTEHKLTTITKVTSGSTMEAAVWVDNLYGSIIKAGTHLAPTIKVAEAAKVIENTQRDLNIALVNELAIIFSKLGIDTLDVLDAAGTKWNFLPFRPGLVGGHCIGVDPYYLTHKAEELGYLPQVVLAGRRINDGMGLWLAEQVVLYLAQRRVEIVGARIVILGLTFKENCPDLRNTKVVDLIQGLKSYGINVDVIDPWANPDEALSEYGLRVKSSVSPEDKYNALVLAVAHQEFFGIKSDEWINYLAPNGMIFDLKGIIPREIKPLRL